MSNTVALYIVATPIGNLEDLSPRAARILSSVNLIAAEDTRTSRKLLVHFGIGTPMISCMSITSVNSFRDCSRACNRASLSH